MHLLILTQTVDSEDTFLGFFHAWVQEFAKEFESIMVICLKEGSHSLPQNVRVLSLGKEQGAGRATYVYRFFVYILRHRKAYDAVFVHMNQEYVLLGGWFWRLMGKKVVMWRNHPAGSVVTDGAAFFCNKVFCTSRFSYTAKYKKTRLMPVGVPAHMFLSSDDDARIPRSILYFGRITPVKKIEKLLHALGVLRERGVPFSATFCGDTLPEYRSYVESLKALALKLGIQASVAFENGVAYEKAPQLYARHALCVNMSPSGSFDKTIFEAMLSGTLVLSCNENLRGEVDGALLFKEDDEYDLAEKLEGLLLLEGAEARKLSESLKTYAHEHHSLQALSKQLRRELERA